jgi:ATP-dependent Clp protease protease subunit
MSSVLNIMSGNQEERWIRFEGAINQNSGNALKRASDQLVASGTKKLHLMINSLGGDILVGQSLFNYLRMLRLEILTYNVGTVQSMAVQIFCLGVRRFCLPNATFFIHPVEWGGKDGQFLRANQLREVANFCDINTKNIAEAVAGQLGKSLEDVMADMAVTRNFNAEESKSYGFVHEIVGPNFFPVNVGYSVIEEDGSVRDFPGKQRMDPAIEALLAGTNLNLPEIPVFNPKLPNPPSKN